MSAASTLNWMMAMAFWIFTFMVSSDGGRSGLPFNAKPTHGSSR